MTSTDEKLGVTEKIGYGFGDLASNLFWQMFSIFIAKYYTDVFLLGAATMGTMLLVTRIGDAVVDPVIGAIADRTRTRWGFFRPYLIWMAIPMALTAVLTFTVPDFEGPARVVYAYATLSLMMIAYSAINIPYSALLGVLSPNSDDRTSACSYRFVMALIPVFIIVNTALPMARYFGGSDISAYGWQMTMLIYSLIAVVLYFATFFMTRERVQPEEKQKTPLATDLKDLLHNRPWVILCVVGVAALTYANIRGTVSIYYFENVVPQGKDYFGPVMTTGAIAFILGVIATSPLSKHFGKRNFYMVSMALTALLTAGFYFVPADNIALIWAAHALISLCAAPTAPLVWAMYADTADYSEWKWGRRATGLVFSAASFAQKFGWAIGGAGTGWLLAYFGYQPNVSQGPVTINGIMLMMSIIPAIGALIAFVALWFYELDEATVKKMTQELKELRARNSAPENSGVLQTLTPASAREHPTSVQAGSAAAAAPAMAAQGMRKASSMPQLLGQPILASQKMSLTGAVRELGPLQKQALRDEFNALLAAGVHGLCFSPYLEGQAPGSPVSAEQIRARLEIIRPHSRWIRSFSCLEGLQEIPRIAHEMGIKTLVGAWLGTDRDINERELAALVTCAQMGHADIVAVGNEVLLREDLNEDELLEYIERVKQAVPGVPVGYVDAYYLFEKYPRIAAACDVVLANCYPFWEACPRESAVAYMQEMMRRAKAAAPGKRVIVSETGWPNQGSPFHAAIPSDEGAMQYFVDTQRWAQSEGIEVFYFAAFDEAWKTGAEGDVGAYWGIWSSSGEPKFS